MKLKAEIKKQLEYVEDLCWLHRSYMIERGSGPFIGQDDETPLDIEAGMIISRHRIEGKYGVRVPDDFDELVSEQERLTSEMSTLRWVLDSDAEWREAGLADT